VRGRVEREGAVAVLASPGDEPREFDRRHSYKRLRGDQDCSVGLYDGGGYRCLTVTQPGEVISTFTDWVTR
jgi:hypothetical protein